MGTLVRLISNLWAHPTYGPIAKHLVRQGTAALVRHVRTKTSSKSWGKIS